MSVKLRPGEMGSDSWPKHAWPWKEDRALLRQVCGGINKLLVLDDRRTKHLRELNRRRWEERSAPAVLDLIRARKARAKAQAAERALMRRGGLEE